MADATAASLLPWLRACGGLVHPAIRVGVTAAGRRGLVATQAIEATAAPLIAVPAPLVLDAAAAGSALAAHHAGRPSLGPALAALDPAAPLALLLAYEMNPDVVATPSPWGLYAQSLSPAAPAGWAVPPPDLPAALDAARVPAAERRVWTDAIAASRTRAADLARAIVTAAGEKGLEAGAPTPPPPPPPSLVEWGLAHVVSRAFRSPAGGGGGPALLPVIDLANHAPGAADPAWARSPGAPYAFATLRSADGSSRTPMALAPGAELATSYATGQGAGGPLEWFLNYGFVPAEAWGVEGRRRRRKG